MQLTSLIWSADTYGSLTHTYSMGLQIIISSHHEVVQKAVAKGQLF